MSAAIRSMTGFARIRKSTPQGEVTVSLKSVNHRGLDLHFHLPGDLDPFEPAMRNAVKRAVLRGHVDVRCQVAGSNDGTHAGINIPLFRSYLEAMRSAAKEASLDFQPDLNVIFQHPGMFTSEEAEPDPGLESAVLSVLEEALDSLNQFRAREGAELAAFLMEQNTAIQTATAEMERIRAQALPAFQQRLTEKLRGLLTDVPAIDPQRLAQEAALLAERSDIGEEIARLKIHAGELAEMIAGGGEIGKKIDFLLQEMNRESNTILSKTGGIGDLGLRVTSLALSAKARIDKIREQALNLE
jgi:uncharacterized protein (TIGR00255 family)